MGTKTIECQFCKNLIGCYQQKKTIICEKCKYENDCVPMLDLTVDGKILSVCPKCIKLLKEEMMANVKTCPVCGQLMYVEQEDGDFWWRCSTCGMKLRNFARLIPRIKSDVQEDTLLGHA